MMMMMMMAMTIGIASEEQTFGDLNEIMRFRQLCGDKKENKSHNRGLTQKGTVIVVLRTMNKQSDIAT